MQQDMTLYELKLANWHSNESEQPRTTRGRIPCRVCRVAAVFDPNAVGVPSAKICDPLCRVDASRWAPNERLLEFVVHFHGKARTLETYASFAKAAASIHKVPASVRPWVRPRTNMSTCSFSDGEEDELQELARLEAEEKKWLAAMQAGQASAAAPAAAPAPSEASILAEENARLKAQLAALESASAVRSTRRHEAELAQQQEELARLNEEKAKMTEALTSGIDLSKLTALKSTSKARSTAVVGLCCRLRDATFLGLLNLLQSSPGRS